MPDTDREMAMLLGQMQAQISSLTKAVETQIEKSDRRGARVYGELESIRAEQADARRNIGALTVRLDNDEPILSGLERWRERGIGMVMVVVVMASALSSIMAIVWKWIATKLGIQ